MKKSVLILVLLMSLLLGCSVKEAQVKPINITVWHYYNGTAGETFDYLVKNFNQTAGLENNIVVEQFSYDSVPDLSKAVEAAAKGLNGANDMPDIFASYADSVVPLYEQGIIANLDDNFTKDELSIYYEPFIEEGRIGDNGELLILPIAKSTEVLHLNKTAFDKFANETGCSYDELKTWEGIAKVAKEYYAWSDGNAFFGTDGMANFMIIGTKQLGNDIFVKENGEIKHQFTKEIAHKFWDVFYVPFVSGHYSAEVWYRSDDVASGEIISYIGSTASSSYFPNEDNQGEIECVTTTYPVFENGDKVAVQQGAGMVISKTNEKEEQAAALFLKWFTEAKINVGFSVSTGYMPVNNEVLSSEYVFAEMARDGVVDEGLPMVLATRSCYEQIEEYDLYTSIPFSGSANARKILENSLPNKIAEDKGSLVTRVNDGENYNAVLKDLVSEKNFELWYGSINNELNLAIHQ